MTILVLSTKNNHAAVEELPEASLDQGRVRRIARGDAAAIKFLDGRYWYLAWDGERMMWFPVNGLGEPRRVER
jgi:hypothetical protein